MSESEKEKESKVWNEIQQNRKEKNSFENQTDMFH